MKSQEGKPIARGRHPLHDDEFRSRQNAKTAALHLLQVQFHGRKLEACGAKGTPKPARPNLPDGGVGPPSFVGGLQKIKPLGQMSDRVWSAMTRRTPTMTQTESDGSVRGRSRGLSATHRSTRSGFPKYSGFESEDGFEADVVEEWKDAQGIAVPDSAERRILYDGTEPASISLPGPENAAPATRKRSERGGNSQKFFVEAGLPRPPSLPNNLPSHTTKSPFGAASHGFYAKRYLEEYEGAAKKFGPSASERHKRVQSARPSTARHRTPQIRAVSAQWKIERNELNDDPFPTKEEASTSTQDWASKSKIMPFMHSDVVFMQELLGKLTDSDCEEPEILKSLDRLIGLVNGSSAASAAIHDQGGVNIILNLMDRLPSAQKIQIKACSLLRSAVRLNGDLISNSIARQGGVEKILKAVELLSSSVARGPMAVPSSDSLLKSTTGRSVSTIFGSDALDAGEEYLDVTEDTSLSYTNLLAVKDGNHRRKKAAAKKSPTPTPVVETTLLSGLIDQYLDPSFLERLERMKRDQRMERMSQLIGVFSKVCRLLTASSYISVETDLEMAMGRMVEDAKSMIQCEVLQLYLVDEETRELIAKEYDTNMDVHEREYLPVIRFPPGRGIAGWVAEHDEPMNVPNAMENDKFDPEVDTRDSGPRRPAAILCIPVRTKDGEIKGVLEAINKISSNGTAVFDDQDEILLRTLGAQAGAIIQNSQTYETIMRTQKKVEVLLATTRSLSSTLELDQLTQTIMNSARELLSADRCTMFLVNHEKKQLHTRIRGRDGMQEVRLDMSVGIAGYVASSGEAVNIKDAYKDSRFNPEIDRQTGYVTKGILCMPIKNTRGKIVGVTQMINSANGFFSLEDEQLLSAFSAQAAVAIEQSYLFKKTEEMRVHLQSIVSSITNCVITLSDNLMVTTINHSWFAEAVGVTSDVAIFGQPLDQWIGERNHLLLQDVRSVYQSSQPVFSAEYELRGPNESTFVNYNIVPLVGDSSRGVVIVLEDISTEKRAMMTLGRYMSPALAKQVMEEGGGELGGTRKRVSILFSDIRSFTTLTESMEPQDVVELLNHHFSDAVDAILAESGILDKYIGDAVMAVFGIPFVSPDDAVHACNTALRIRDALTVTNEERQKKGLDVLRIGIGINTGESLVGNIGNKQRMEYTVIGDSCNLASRAEGLTKYYGVQTLITEHTLQDTGDAFLTREIDQVIVVGRSTGVRLYELLSRKTDVIDPKTLLVSDAYAKGLSLYRKKQFTEAIEVFAENWKKYGDRPSEVLLERCHAYLLNPPPKDWDAVHRADHK